MRGEILPPGISFLRLASGTAERDGVIYTLSTSAMDSPIVRSERTGKTFHLSWSDILDMAIEAGIDEI